MNTPASEIESLLREAERAGEPLAMTLVKKHGVSVEEVFAEAVEMVSRHFSTTLQAVGFGS